MMDTKTKKRERHPKLTEKRVREIVREEIYKYHKERILERPYINPF